MNDLTQFILLAIISVIQCQLVPCPDDTITDECGRCSSHNDPHILTFDGIYYDHHNDGCFKYVTQCPGSSVILPFEVCGCHTPCTGEAGQKCEGPRGPRNIRCIGDISISFYDTTTGSNTMDIDINITAPLGTTAIDTASGSLTSGSSYTFDSSSGHNFRYELQTVFKDQHFFEIYSGPSSIDTFYGYISYQTGNLEILLSANYFSSTTNVCGLCGYFDQDGGIDDFLGMDNVTYLDPNDISGVISQTVNNDIELFANTYLCNPLDPAPYNHNCSISPNADDCFLEAEKCCDQLFNQSIWKNTIVTEIEFKNNWIIGCARDACALTNNNVPFVCDLTTSGLSFAADILQETATNTYPSAQCGNQPIKTITNAHADSTDPAPCSLKIIANGDEFMNVTLTKDDGITWNLIDYTTSWNQDSITITTNVGIDTRVQFHVMDSSKVDSTDKIARGFVATVYLYCPNGVEYVWFTSCGNFAVLSNEDSNGLITTPPDPSCNLFNYHPYGLTWGLSNPDMHPNAQWVWNFQHDNKMTLEFDLGNYPNVISQCGCDSQDTPSPTEIITTPEPTIIDNDDKNCSVKICCHGDDYMKLKVSYDGGNTWSAVSSSNSWQTTMSGYINPLDINTILQFTVTDSGIAVGGFLCTLTLRGTNGYQYDIFTDQPNTYFDVISEIPNGDTIIDVFTPFGDNPWGWYVNPKKIECMNKKADWIWNNHKGNTMIFEVDFTHHSEILEKLDCIAPTPSPTDTGDCCDLSIDDYLSMCYCDAAPSECCDPLTRPTPFSNPVCKEGSACCPDGSWSCSIGDGKTFPCGATYLRKGIDTFGNICCDNDCICPDVYDPVCCNGQTYSNLCYANCKCETQCSQGACINPTSNTKLPVKESNVKQSYVAESNVKESYVKANSVFGMNSNVMMKNSIEEIKYMIYGTWTLIFSCFVIMLLINIKSNCESKKNQFKVVYDDDDI